MQSGLSGIQTHRGHTLSVTLNTLDDRNPIDTGLEQTGSPCANKGSRTFQLPPCVVISQHKKNIPAFLDYKSLETSNWPTGSLCANNSQWFWTTRVSRLAYCYSDVKHNLTWPLVLRQDSRRSDASAATDGCWELRRCAWRRRNSARSTARTHNTENTHAKETSPCQLAHTDMYGTGENLSKKKVKLCRLVQCSLVKSSKKFVDFCGLHACWWQTAIRAACADMKQNSSSEDTPSVLPLRESKICR